MPRQEVVDSVLPAFLRYHERAVGYGFWAVIDRTSGTSWAGSTCARRATVARTRSRSSGTACASQPEEWAGRTEGPHALVEKAFAAPCANRVWAETMAVNAASRRVMEKGGLRYVRLLHQQRSYEIPGDEHGGVEYGAHPAGMGG